MTFFYLEPIAIDLSASVTEGFNVIGIDHDFPGTGDVALYANGSQVQPIRYNPRDGRHYGSAYFPEDTEVAFEFVDSSGDMRTFTASTLPTRTQPTAVRQRYVSPDVTPGNGDLADVDNPGNIDDAYADLTAGDEIIFAGGTYYTGELSWNKSPLIIKAKSGETPILSGAREASITWTLVGDGVYSTPDYDPDTKQVHALINGNVERLNDTTLAKLAGVTGTAQGGSANSITLPPGFSGADNTYNDQLCEITSGTGAGQTAWIRDYTGGTKVAITGTWATPPDATSVVKVSAPHGWEIQGGLLYIKLSSDKLTHVPLDPSTTTVYLPRANTKWAMGAFVPDVWIEGITIEHYGAFTSSARGILVQAANCTIKDCVIRHIHQIGVYPLSTTDCLIDGCTFTERQDWLTQLQGKGFAEAATTLYMSSCERVTIRNCTLSGHMDSITANHSTEVNIYDNIIVSTKDETIDLFGAVVQNRMWGNQYFQPHHITGMATALNGPVIWINEKAWDAGYVSEINQAMDMDNFSNVGYKFNYTSPGTIAQQFHWHCTRDNSFGAATNFLSSRLWDGLATFPQGQANCVNSVWTGYGKLMYDSDAASVFGEWNHNQYYSTDEYGYGSVFRYHNVDQASFADWQTASGLDADSVYADPVLVNGMPTVPTQGVHVPGITGNAVLGVTTTNKGAQ